MLKSVGNEGLPSETSKLTVLAVTTITTFMTPFMISAVNLALPAIQAEFRLDAVMLSWIANAYLLAAGVFMVPAGRFADMFGKRRVFLAGILVFALFSACLGWAGSILSLLIYRTFQGIGAAMIMTTGIAIISDVFPPSERGQAIGINVAAVYIGLSTGPFAGGILTGAFGWRSIFLVIAVFGIVCFVMSLLRIGDDRQKTAGGSMDIAGSLLYGASLITGMYGLTVLPSAGGIGLLITGAIFLGMFVRHELKTPCPVMELRLFSRNRVFAFSSLAALINYGATFAVSFLLSLYLQYVKGMTPQSAGIVLVCQPVVQALLSPLAGRLSDRVEPLLIASAGMSLSAAGLALLIFLDAHTPTAYIVFSLFVLGIGFALFSSPNMNAIMSSVEKQYFGLASGTVSTMRLIGQMLSMAIATLIFSVQIGKGGVGSARQGEFLDAVSMAFMVFAVLCAVGIWFSMKRGALRA